MFWEVCQVCGKTVKMDGRVCEDCQHGIFRCVLCDKICKKEKGYKICRKCLMANPNLCPVCLEVKDKKDFPSSRKANRLVCRNCTGREILKMYPEYIESQQNVINSSFKKLVLLKSIMEKMQLEIKDVSIKLGVSKAKVYGWLYSGRGIEISKKEIEKMQNIV